MFGYYLICDFFKKRISVYMYYVSYRFWKKILLISFGEIIGGGWYITHPKQSFPWVGITGNPVCPNKPRNSKSTAEASLWSSNRSFLKHKTCILKACWSLYKFMKVLFNSPVRFQQWRNLVCFTFPVNHARYQAKKCTT